MHQYKLLSENTPGFLGTGLCGGFFDMIWFFQRPRNTLDHF